MLPLITLEEHYISPIVRETNKAARDHYLNFPPHLLSKLESLSDERIADLEKGNISLQVISHGPVNASAATCFQANDELASAISKNPTRLAAFAMLPMGDPASAANELERMFLDRLRKAQELDVPNYIHPTFASDELMDHYKGDYDDKVASALSAYGWGWHTETGLHILRLFASGLFDGFPKLRIVIGHMGEMLPFQLERIISVSKMWGKKERALREVWKNNIWITTSGMFSLPPLACLLQTTTIDHVLYSVDYPFSANEKGLNFLGEIEKSGLLKGTELEMFAFRNAEGLLRVKARSS